MIRRVLLLRRVWLPSAPLVAILLTVPPGCESARKPAPPAKSQAAPARPTVAESAPEADAGARESAPLPAATADVDETTRPESAPQERPSADEDRPTAEETAADDDPLARDPQPEETAVDAATTAADPPEGLPAREDLPDEEFAAANVPAATEPPNPTVGVDSLLAPTEGLKRVHEVYNVWVNPQTKQVVMSAEVCRREGALEMFACLTQTKEHESILSVFTEAQVVHALLMALGAQPGRPVEFVPEYKAAAGPEIEVTVYWRDDAGKVREARGQDWVRDIRTKEPLAHPWVFGGSGFWKDQTTGQEHYLAEYGDFICVSNFSSAMIDLPIESSQSEAGLLFEPFTERIPPMGSRVTLVLTPTIEPADENAAADAAPGAPTGIERHDL